jgi:hypothetical protein
MEGRDIGAVRLEEERKKAAGRDRADIISTYRTSARRLLASRRARKRRRAPGPRRLAFELALGMSTMFEMADASARISGPSASTRLAPAQSQQIQGFAGGEARRAAFSSRAL